MFNRLKKNRGKQRGQVLIIVLALLALGGVTIASTLNYSSTILMDNRILNRQMDGTYSAAAGIEYAIWALEHGEGIPSQLSSSVNGMTVLIDEVDHGIFTMYCGELTYVEDLPVHYNWITTNSSAVCAGGTCNYTVWVNWEGNDATQRKLVELGVTLPPGYTYVDDSADDFEGNITDDNPDEIGDAPGGQQWLKWLWNTGQGPPITADNATQYETFKITGSGPIEDDYSWVALQSNDIGLVGEYTGQRYTITGNASGPGVGINVIEADILLVGGTIYVASWKIIH